MDRHGCRLFLSRFTFGWLALFFVLLFAQAAAAQESPFSKFLPGCGKCVTIADDYAKAWAKLSALLKQADDLQATIERYHQAQLKKDFGGDVDQGELDKLLAAARDANNTLKALPEQIAEARKVVDARYTDLLDCLKRKCFELDQTPSPPIEVNEPCKACIEIARRVADLTGRLVRLRGLAAQLESQVIPSQEAVVRDAEAAHIKSGKLASTLAALKDQQKLLDNLKGQLGAIRDAIGRIDDALAKAKGALDICRSKNCPPQAVTPPPPPPPPPPPVCPRCQRLKDQITRLQGQIDDLKATQKLMQDGIDQKQADIDKGILPKGEQKAVDADKARVKDIDEKDIPAIQDEIKRVTKRLEDCQKVPCVEGSGGTPAKPPAGATPPVKKPAAAQPPKKGKKPTGGGGSVSITIGIGHPVEEKTLKPEVKTITKGKPAVVHHPPKKPACLPGNELCQLR